MPQPLPIPSWKDVRTQLYCVLVTDKVRRQLPPDALIRSIAGQFDVSFAFAGPNGEFTVTTQHLKRWRVSADKLGQTAGWNEPGVWDWPAVKAGMRLFQYPDRDTGWVGHVVAPGCLLEHTDVPATPIIMVPNERTVFIAGSTDEDAQRAMLRKCLQLCRKRPPLTRRPLAIDKRWKNWELFADDRNPFAAEYQSAFGIV